MGIGIFNKLKRFGRGFISGIKDIFNDPKVKDAVTNGVNGAKNDIVNGVTNGVTNVVKNANVVLDKNKLLKGLSTETMDNIKEIFDQGSLSPVVSFASRKWIPKFKN